jgi:predicted MFS family arabinose efflux permease
MFLAMPFQNFMVVFADQVWQVGERGLGLMMGLSGLGGVIGSAWVAQRGERTDRTRLMIANSLMFGLLLIVFSLTHNFYYALIPLILANACASASQTLNNTTSQLLVDDAQRGRMSAFMMMAFGLTPLGVLPLAFLAERIGVQWATVSACTILVVVVVIFYLQSQTLKSLDQSVEKKLANQLD